MCFQFRPGHSGMCECSFQFRLCRSILKHRHSISCFVTHFRQLQFKHETAKNNFVYRHSFSSKFQSNSSPRCRGPITLDRILNLFEGMTNFILHFLLASVGRTQRGQLPPPPPEIFKANVFFNSDFIFSNCFISYSENHAT